jgi:hypothetical protein
MDARFLDLGDEPPVCTGYGGLAGPQYKSGRYTEEDILNLTCTRTPLLAVQAAAGRYIDCDIPAPPLYKLLGEIIYIYIYI